VQFVYHSGRILEIPGARSPKAHAVVPEAYGPLPIIRRYVEFGRITLPQRSHLSLINLPLSLNSIPLSGRKIATHLCQNRTGGFHMTNPIPTPIPNPKSPTPNRATGPRTAAGKQRSSQNALTHGLTSRSPVLATEDRAAYDAHCRGFFDEYQPATPTETQLTQELVDTAWRINRIPALEAALLDRADLDIVDAHRALATLGMHYQRLSRQFQKTVDHLRDIQSERRREQERELKRAAALLELYKHKGIAYDPAQDGFVFPQDQVEAFSDRLKRLNQSRHIEHVLFHMSPATNNQ
jgi:hypothetical protein